MLAEQLRALGSRKVIEQACRLRLHERRLLFDKQQLSAPICEGLERLRLQWPDKRRLVDRHAQPFQAPGIQPKLLQSLHHVQPRLARSHNAQRTRHCCLDAMRHAVEPIRVGIRLRSRQLVPHQSYFIFQGVEGYAGMQPARR